MIEMSVGDLDSPLLIKHAVEDWPALRWNPDCLSDVLKDKKFRCKVLEKNSRNVHTETDCLYMMCSMTQYTDWLHGICSTDNPLKSLSTHMYSLYIDYKYMKDMFADCPELLQAVNWKNFGFPDRDGSDSTIWIGSAGAYTPCHQDTYGFNLVTQIYGSKTWILFPPSQTTAMYPTRIPYEESSVFSDVNILNPDLDKHSLFKETTPYIIELHRGDSLYVPRHWWHFVQCTESSISVNTWLPMKEDHKSHVSEAVTRFLMTAVLSSLPDIETQRFINPHEEVTTCDKSLMYLKTAVDTYRNNLIEVQGNICKNRDINVDSKSDNLTKLKNQFKDYEVKQSLCYKETVRNCETSNIIDLDVSPQKKRKICGNETSSATPMKTKKLEIYRISSSTFDKLLKWQNLQQDKSEGESLGQQKCKGSDKDCISQSEMYSSDLFLEKFMNAVFQPNVINQITKNTLNDTS